MGRHCARLLRFMLTYGRQGDWHSYGTDQPTVRAVRWGVAHGFYEHSDTTRQIRLAGKNYLEVN